MGLPMSHFNPVCGRAPQTIPVFTMSTATEVNFCYQYCLCARLPCTVLPMALTLERGQCVHNISEHAQYPFLRHGIYQTKVFSLSARHTNGTTGPSSRVFLTRAEDPRSRKKKQLITNGRAKNFNLKKKTRWNKSLCAWRREMGSSS